MDETKRRLAKMYCLIQAYIPIGTYPQNDGKEQTMNKYVSLEDVAKMALSMTGLSNTEWVQALQGLPTIDIVRCKECKWWPDRCKLEPTGSNDFCSSGKEEDE